MDKVRIPKACVFCQGDLCGEIDETYRSSKVVCDHCDAYYWIGNSVLQNYIVDQAFKGFSRWRNNKKPSRLQKLTGLVKAIFRIN